MPEHYGVAEAAVRFVFQVGVILFAAKIFAEIFERFLKQPPVLGELLAGMLIGPYALGPLIPGPGGPLFQPHPGSTIPVSETLWAFAQFAVVLLLFITGLETEFEKFMRYGPPAAVVATGGVVLPFLFGQWLTVAFGYAKGPGDPHALFMGAALTATSVGITARVLSDIGKLSTPEGVTILAGAVIDDVLGILVLAVVVSISRAGHVSPARIALLGVKALGFWLALLGVFVLLSGRISRALMAFRSEGAGVALAVALCLIVAALTESFGLAMIIGAYALGLALSRTELAEELISALRPMYHTVVPVFFVVMGMLVDLPAMTKLLGFGLVITLAALVGKLAGCALPALAVGFNWVGAVRIGMGMVPRGEVALIVAGVGLAAGAISPEMFGVAVMMTFVTTLLPPILLVPLFQRGGEGTRHGG